MPANRFYVQRRTTRNPQSTNHPPILEKVELNRGVPRLPTLQVNIVKGTRLDTQPIPSQTQPQTYPPKNKTHEEHPLAEGARAATRMPLIKVSSSGISRSSRTKRLRRRSRKSRKGPAKLREPWTLPTKRLEATETTRSPSKETQTKRDGWRNIGNNEKKPNGKPTGTCQ